MSLPDCELARASMACFLLVWLGRSSTRLGNRHMAKTTTAPIDPLYEINEACERLKCSPPTLYRLDDDGEITLLKIRGKTLVAGVEALIARQLEAAELRRLAQEAGAAPPVACQITTEAPCGM